MLKPKKQKLKSLSVDKASLKINCCGDVSLRLGKLAHEANSKDLIDILRQILEDGRNRDG